MQKYTFLNASFIGRQNGTLVSNLLALLQGRQFQIFVTKTYIYSDHQSQQSNKGEHRGGKTRMSKFSTTLTLKIPKPCNVIHPQQTKVLHLSKWHSPWSHINIVGTTAVGSEWMIDAAAHKEGQLHIESDPAPSSSNAHSSSLTLGRDRSSQTMPRSCCKCCKYIMDGIGFAGVRLWTR